MKASICALSCLTEVKDPLAWGAQELPRIGHRHASAVANGGHHAHRTRSLVATARQSGCQGGARQPTCSKPRPIGAAIHASIAAGVLRELATGSIQASTSRDRSTQSGRQEPYGRAEPRHGIESSRLDRSRQSTGRPPAAMERAFSGVGCRALSPMSTPAFPHDHRMPYCSVRRIEIDGKEYPYFDQLVWPEIATTPGLPATAIPIDRSETGLPIGVQIVGPYLEDRTTIAFAELMEREFGGFVPPPGYAG